jgi:hypothetical protein
VVLEAQPALLPLLRSLDGVAQLMAVGDALPSADLQIPLMSLPLAFQTTLDTIPWSGPYLQADPNRAATWRGVLDASAPLRIGLVWSGNPTHRNDARRSVAFAALYAALPKGPQYICLQPELRPADQEAVHSAADLAWVGPQLTDFGETAALVSQLDLVISVDTSVVHVAGALGTPAWMLTPFAPDWRWGVHGTSTPWYPSITLYRQSAVGDWRAVLARVAQDVAARL